MKLKLVKSLSLAFVLVASLGAAPPQDSTAPVANNCDACLNGSYGSACYACCTCVGNSAGHCLVGCAIWGNE